MANIKYDKIASDIEKKIFNTTLSKDRNGKFKRYKWYIFYSEMDKGINLSRFKIYITNYYPMWPLEEDKNDEIAELIKMRKTSVRLFTTNYDTFDWAIFEFWAFDWQ